jgi:hypothetical protein
VEEAVAEFVDFYSECNGSMTPREVREKLTIITTARDAAHKEAMKEARAEGVQFGITKTMELLKGLVDEMQPAIEAELVAAIARSRGIDTNV